VEEQVAVLVLYDERKVDFTNHKTGATSFPAQPTYLTYLDRRYGHGVFCETNVEVMRKNY
jgi:hypothetical protein